MVALTRRDDLESLAYSLFSILRGNLPWNKSHVHASTPRNIRRYVYAKKRGWSGARLAEGYDEALGQFLDEMRNLEFHEAPHYDRWRVSFAEIADRRGEALPFDSCAGNITLDRNLTKAPRPVCVIEPGQLIYAQLLPRITVKDYTLVRGDPSHRSLSDEAWSTVPRPAVVLRVSRSLRSKIIVDLALITRRHLDDSVVKVLLSG
jgi:hypothetical protein